MVILRSGPNYDIVCSFMILTSEVNGTVRPFVSCDMAFLLFSATVGSLLKHVLMCFVMFYRENLSPWP